MAQGVVSLLWGADLFSQLQEPTDYSNPAVVNIHRVTLLFQHLGLFILPSILFSLLVSNSWKEYMSFSKPQGLFLAAAAVAMLLSLPAINALAWLNESVHLPESLKALEAVFSEMEERASQLTTAITDTTDPLAFAFNVIVIAIVPAVGEEMIFRGLILPIFRKWTGKLHLSVWLSAAFFSAMHMQFYGFVPRLLLGALLGYLFVWSRNIWTPIIAHFTNNFLALILLFLIARGDIDESLDRFDLAAADISLLAISLIILSAVLIWIYKRKVPNRPSAPETQNIEDL